MAEWKKVIVSGSTAILNGLTLPEIGAAASVLAVDEDGVVSATAISGISGDATNLSGTTATNQLTIVSSTGDDLVVAEASNTIAGLMSVAHHDKLDGIEASADVTDATNVTAAGALMDSELTDLAGVKGVTISTLQPKPSEGAFANGDKTKLDGIEASADVTDTTNVTAAGALMDSELTDLAGVKGVTISTLQPKPSEGAFANGDKTKLDNIASNATVDQSQSDINNLAITSVGALNGGSITSGFGAIDVGDDNITTTGIISGSTIQTAALFVTGSAEMSGDLVFNGITFSETSVAIVTGSTTTGTSGGTDTHIFHGDVEVTGSVHVSSNVNVDGILEGDQLDINGTADISGNLAVGGTVDGVDIATRDGILTSTTTTANNALPKAGGQMTGNITFAGSQTVDGVDISARDSVLTSTTTTANNALPKAGGQMTGNITFAGSQTVDGVDISALATTVGTISGVADAALPLAGGQMTGNITFAGSQTVDGVDISARDSVLTTTTTTANNALPKAGGQMTGNITFAGSQTVDGVDISARDSVLTTTTTTANNALPKAGGQMTGNITFAGSQTVDGVDISALATTVSNITSVTGTSIVSALNGNLGNFTIGDTDDIVTFANDVVVNGDLTVKGDNVVMEITTLKAEDPFIQIGDGVGSAGADFGIIFGDTGAGSGSCLMWDGNYNGDDGRMGISNALSAEATSATPNYHLAGVFEGTDGDSQTAQADHVGNIRIESSEIYIYV